MAVYESTEEFIAALEAMPDPWWNKLRRAAKLRGLRRALRTPLRWYHRARYGYSDWDVWDMHHYLADVALRMTVDTQAHMCGHPSDLTEQEWFDKLSAMERGWMAALAISEDDVDGADHDREMQYFRDGMAEFTERFFHLWD